MYLCYSLLFLDITNVALVRCTKVDSLANTLLNRFFDKLVPNVDVINSFKLFRVQRSRYCNASY